jgi:hypothetical protein
MDSPTLLLGLMTLALIGVTLQAWRMGNEKRDVALLGACSGVLGLGTVLAVAL